MPGAKFIALTTTGTAGVGSFVFRASGVHREMRETMPGKFDAL